MKHFFQHISPVLLASFMDSCDFMLSMAGIGVLMKECDSNWETDQRSLSSLHKQLEIKKKYQ